MKSIKKQRTIGIIWIIPIIIVLRIAEIFVVQKVGLFYNEQLVKKCLGQKICNGRIQALEHLVKANDRLNKFDLSEANLTGIDLSDANLRDINLVRAVLTGGDLTKAILDRGELRAAHLKGTNLTEAKLFRANLRGADLIVAILTNAELTDVDLTGAELYRAKLDRADLTSAKLIGANLYRADLTSANLKNADLRAVDLTGAELKDADLTGADFRSLNIKATFDASGKSKNLELSGIGFTISRGDNNYHVNTIYKDTPAEKAGIKRGDRISKINGNSIDRLDINQMYNLLFDRLNTTVELTIKRNNLETDYSLKSELLTLPVIGITPEQIKQADNWEKACYDRAFREKLGLSSKQIKEC